MKGGKEEEGGGGRWMKGEGERREEGGEGEIIYFPTHSLRWDNCPHQLWFREDSILPFSLQNLGGVDGPVPVALQHVVGLSRGITYTTC